MARSHPKRQIRRESGDSSVSLMTVLDPIGAASKACRVPRANLFYEGKNASGTDGVPRRPAMHEIFGTCILHRTVNVSSNEHKQAEVWEDLRRFRSEGCGNA